MCEGESLSSFSRTIVGFKKYPGGKRIDLGTSNQGEKVALVIEGGKVMGATLIGTNTFHSICTPTAHRRLTAKEASEIAIDMMALYIYGCANLCALYPFINIRLIYINPKYCCLH